jgi:mRNA interferase HigB
MVRIIARNKLIAFWTEHPETAAALRHWHDVASAAEWQSPPDVMADFTKAKSLNGERVRFEVAGGNYRMVVAFDWRRSIAFIKFIGTHGDYDRIDALTVSLF